MADPFDRAFAALEPRERNSLRAISIARSYDRGEVLFHQGDDPGALHAIMRGRVKISAVTEDAREALFSLAGPGDLVGEISALAGRQRTATVRALEPVGSLAMPADSLRAAVSGSSRLAMFFLEIAADRLQAADLQRLEFVGHDVLGRVARRLNLLVQESGQPVADGIMLDVFLSQEELASWTAASREAVNRALHQLRAVGCLRSERRRMIVTDLDALRRYAGVPGSAR
jgi:CRP/FNR family transcriptional regulator, cyclic AMP receptor protein